MGVAYFWWWLIGVFFRPSKVRFWWSVTLYIEGLAGFASSLIRFVSLVFVRLCSPMSANSSTESLSPTNSENGDNDNINHNSPTSFIAEPALLNNLDRGGSDH